MRGRKAIDCGFCGYGIAHTVWKMDNDGHMETYMQCGKCNMYYPPPEEDIKLVKSMDKQGGYFRDFIYKGEDRSRYGSKYLRDEKGNIIGEKE